jgi:hypothetical protein
VLGHPWVCVDGVAPDKPLDSAVLSRLKQFSAMNKLKKMALRVSTDINFLVCVIQRVYVLIFCFYLAYACRLLPRVCPKKKLQD